MVTTAAASYTMIISLKKINVPLPLTEAVSKS